jgi:hypothetical protein
VRAFTTTELARLQSTQESAMQDTCDLLIYTQIGTDTHGLPVEDYLISTTSECGLDLRASKELVNAEMHVYDARLRLPIDTVIGGIDRIRITHRFGVLLATPLEFDLLGETRRGPSGLVLNLRNV